MYGKFFASTFTGSMFGAGSDVFAVWAYVIATAEDSSVELNPVMLASTLGTTPNLVESAIEYLCRPDPNSRNKAEDGRRLIREGAYQYRVVSHALYRQLRNEDERREYNRVKKQESRARLSSPVKPTVIDMSTLPSAYASASDSAVVPEGGVGGTAAPPRSVATIGPLAQSFERFWALYPKKVGKQIAMRAWVELAPDATLAAVIGASVVAWKGTDAWQDQAGRFVPQPGRWLAERRWTDVPPKSEKELVAEKMAKEDLEYKAMMARGAKP